MFEQIPDSQYGHTLAAMVDYLNYPVLIAGQDIYDPYINKVEYFNGKSWELTASLPVNVRYHTALAVGERIFVFGGFYYRTQKWVIGGDKQLIHSKNITTTEQICLF